MCQGYSTRLSGHHKPERQIKCSEIPFNFTLNRYLTRTTYYIIYRQMLNLNVGKRKMCQGQWDLAFRLLACNSSLNPLVPDPTFLCVCHQKLLEMKMCPTLIFAPPGQLIWWPVLARHQLWGIAEFCVICQKKKIHCLMLADLWAGFLRTAVLWAVWQHA